MKEFVGLKRVKATQMTRQEYVDYRSWELPLDENGADKGYFIEHLDATQPNHENHDGYISWIPADMFEQEYLQKENLTFGMAIEAAKQGKKIARKKWNGKNMFVVYMEPLYLPPFNTADTFRKVNDRTAKFIGEDKPLDCQPYFAMYNAQEQWIPGWLANQSDMLDDDWFVVD